ncbi:MAG TPA: aldehyde ferredoxin oxidoreductase C-terminal domain-containing protein [Candidatus Tectomicrobia bacterium]|jgi:aldehyde:ferredoxin oxidoreductase
MWTEITSETKHITDYRFRRVIIDLTQHDIRQATIACQDMEDFLGGIGRAFKLLGDYDVSDAFAPSAPLLMNLGVLSGTEVMTGLRTFFSAYSPLKVANNGRPLAMWSTASGDFGTRMLLAGVDEVLLLGRAPHPVYLLMCQDGDTPRLSLEDASDLLGKTTHDKIMLLAERHADAHIAALGPAGEHWQQNYYAAIACSTGNELQAGDCKPRFAGRGGMGSIMGSKNLMALVAQAPIPKRSKLPAAVLEANKEISRGEGSRNYRDRHKGNGAGGTWRNIAGLHPLGALPEMNFWPQGNDRPVSLYRDSLEAPYVIKDESCFKCGIACHKNIYDVQQENGRRKAGKFYTKFDYEPLDLLTINLGIYDPQQSLHIVELVDQLGFDSISLGVTLGYIMDYNRQQPNHPILDGLAFGDFAATCRIIEQTAAGQLPQVGQGVKRLAEALGATAYAMHCKGLELPAYLPETNPGYPFAIAGGHMAMRTFLFLVFEGKTDLDYWVDAIVKRGIYYTRDDLIGLCKFAGTPDRVIEPSFKALYGVDVTSVDMQHATQRTYLRGLLLERKQGTTLDDYVLPARAYEHNPHVQLPHFITPEFWQELRSRVFQAFEEQIEAYGLRSVA